MITKTITAENQYTDPIYVPSGTSLTFEIKQKTTDPAADWVARVVVQEIPDENFGKNLPNGASTDWTEVDSFDMSVKPVTKRGYGNCAWYRVGVKTGAYTSGNATIKVWLTR